MSALSPQIEAALVGPAGTDGELVTRVLDGDRPAYAILVRRYNQRLYRIVRAIVRDDAEAEDVVQQVQVNAFHNLAQFRGEASFATWLGRIAVNEALGRVRAQRRLGPLEVVDDIDPPDDGPGPADVTYRRQMSRLLEAEIDQLPENLRVVLVLRDVEELDTAETASCLRLTEAAVRVRLHRARHLLQERLSRVMESFPEAYRFAGDRCERMLIAVVNALSL